MQFAIKGSRRFYISKHGFPERFHRSGHGAKRENSDDNVTTRALPALLCATTAGAISVFRRDYVFTLIDFPAGG